MTPVGGIHWIHNSLEGLKIVDLNITKLTVGEKKTLLKCCIARNSESGHTAQDSPSTCIVLSDIIVHYVNYGCQLYISTQFVT